MLEMYVLEIALKVQAINACNLNLNLLHLIPIVYCYCLKFAYCKHTKLCIVYVREFVKYYLADFFH